MFARGYEDEGDCLPKAKVQSLLFTINHNGKLSYPSFRTELPRLVGTRTQTGRADWNILLAVLMSSSVLMITLAAVVSYASYDFPPQVLLDEFMPIEERWEYYLSIDEGSWVVVEVTSDVQVEISVEYRNPYGHLEFQFGPWTAYHRVVTLGELTTRQQVRMLVDSVMDGNVTVEIIDSSQSVTISIHVLLASPWFLLLCFATLALDVSVVVRWSRVRASMRRTRLDGIDENGFKDELRISRSYLVLSWIRELKSRLFRNGETSEAS